MADTTDGQELWLARPDIWSGALLATAAATRSFAPSLLPRRTSHQALVSGIASAAGFAVGNATYGAVARTGSTVGDLAALGVVAAAGGAARQASRRGSTAPLRWSVVHAAGDAALVGSLAAAAAVAVRGSRTRFLAGSVAAGAVGLLGVREVRRGIVAQQALREQTDPPPPRPVRALTSAMGVAGLLAGVTNGYRHSGLALARLVRRRFGMSDLASEAAGGALAVGLWVGTGKALADAAIVGLRLYDRVVDPGYDDAPECATRSAGPGSPLSFARLGREGRRFVVSAPTISQIEQVMGRTATCEPVRVFVGHASARTDHARVALAIDELRRTGGFERSLLVVACPAGNGHVNSVPLEVLDYVRAGDVASVAVQYGILPSILTLNRVSRGARLHRLLLTAIHDELAGRPPVERPRVVVYGESLGAWAGQDAFLHRGVAGLDELGVERALWVGTPYFSSWRRQVLHGGPTPAPGGAMIEVQGPDELAGLDAPARAGLRVVVLSHDNDPVCYLSGALLVKPPPWLDEPRPARVPAAMRFVPLVTAVAVAVDAVNATRPIPGRFRATAHEYHADLPEVVLDAYGIERPSPEVWAALVEHLQSLDASRAAKARTLPEPEASVPEPPSPTRRWPREGQLRPRRAERPRRAGRPTTASLSIRRRAKNPFGSHTSTSVR